MLLHLCHFVRKTRGITDDDSEKRNTVNVDIFALFIFLRNLRFLNIRENMYISKITFIFA